MTAVLRTPDERFFDLPGFGFEPHYVTIPSGIDGIDGLRVHYLDEGPRDGRIVLLMHGEPSWCFLYRHMIPVLTAAGYRCIAPDLIGFGRSDKLDDRTEYTYARHVEWVRAALFDQIGIEQCVLVCQDWGGLIGLRLVGEHPERFSAVCAANTFLNTGDVSPGKAFRQWLEFSQKVETFPTGAIVSSGCATDLAPEVVAAYDAPFPDESYKEGARQFPTLVPASPDNPASAANRAAWDVLRAFTNPFLTAFSDQDAVTAGGEKPMQAEIPGAEGQPHTIIEGAGHFLQEDKGVELATVIVDWLG